MKNIKNIPKVNVEKCKQESLCLNFSKFNLEPVSFNGEFNNYFKNNDHYLNVVTGFLKNVLPKITSLTYNKICETTSNGREIHFHTIDDTHRPIVRNILKKYNFSDITINQMFEGNSIFEFSATLGKKYPARIVCHKIDNVLYLLFFDTNHHIYFNQKYTGESLFYDNCPNYIGDNCCYMPNDCFAVSYLDSNKIQETYGYDYDPQLSSNGE